MHSLQAQAQPATGAEIAFAGNCGVEIQNDRVLITVAEIANHREEGKISGTLAVELLALNQPYTADDSEGTILAATRIGELYDRHFLSDCRYDLIFTEPPPGTWYLSLRLREWTESDYAARDRVDFSTAYTVPDKPAAENVSEACTASTPTTATANTAELQNYETATFIPEPSSEDAAAAVSAESSAASPANGMIANFLHKIRRFLSL